MEERKKEQHKSFSL